MKAACQSLEEVLADSPGPIHSLDCLLSLSVPPSAWTYGHQMGVWELGIVPNTGIWESVILLNYMITQRH